MDWLTPTLRATRCAPAIAAAGLGLLVLGTLRLFEQPLPDGLHVAVLVMIVLGGLTGLHDPGRNLVHALPVPASRRLLHRLVLLAPLVALGLAAVCWSLGRLFPVSGPAPGWAALAALGATGVGLCAMLTRRIGPRAADVALSVMLGWIVAGFTLSGAELPRWLAMPWWSAPAVVGLSAAAVAIAATTSGTRA
jgi:hypothetical protein